MEFTYLDYCPLYYSVDGKPAMPPERGGKFVQLRHRNVHEYCIVSPLELTRWHANIVERFLQPFDVPGEYNSDKDMYHLYDDDWVIPGGGHWVINDTLRTLRFFSVSQAYGRYDCAGLHERLSQVEELAGYSLTLE